VGDAAVRAAALLGRGYLRLLQATARFREEGLDRVARAREAAGPILWCFWHNRLLGPLIPHRNRQAGVVISQSRDGELISRVVEGFGYVGLRGSSTRGGSDALRAVLRHLRAGKDVAFTPDGPRGPRYTVHPGVVYVARRTGLPVVPLGVAYSRRRVFGSWDRFQLPLPLGTVCLWYGEPLFVGPELSEPAAREAVRDAISAATKAAEAHLGVTSP
jgi:lysophospholipid acyltransferase (LPLAT)-like uncharacterized protein